MVDTTATHKYAVYSIQLMRTTIAVQPETLLLLKQCKERYATQTYDEALRRLLREQQPAASLFGSLKHVKAPFVREKHDRLA